MSDKKSLSFNIFISFKVLMEQIGTYLCLYDKSKMSYKERDVNGNAWSKVTEKLDFM